MAAALIMNRPGTSVCTVCQVLVSKIGKPPVVALVVLAALQRNVRCPADDLRATAIPVPSFCISERCSTVWAPARLFNPQPSTMSIYPVFLPANPHLATVSC